MHREGAPLRLSSSIHPLVPLGENISTVCRQLFLPTRTLVAIRLRQLHLVHRQHRRWCPCRTRCPDHLCNQDQVGVSLVRARLVRRQRLRASDYTCNLCTTNSRSTMRPCHRYAAFSRFIPFGVFTVYSLLKGAGYSPMQASQQTLWVLMPSMIGHRLSLLSRADSLIFHHRPINRYQARAEVHTAITRVASPITTPKRALRHSSSKYAEPFTVAWWFCACVVTHNRKLGRLTI